MSWLGCSSARPGTACTDVAPVPDDDEGDCEGDEDDDDDDDDDDNDGYCYNFYLLQQAVSPCT